jgi:hypothetical protein
MTESAERTGQKRQTWKVLGWVGCGGLAAALVLFLLLLGLGFFGQRIEANKKLARQVPSWVPLYPGTQAKDARDWPNMDPREVEGTIILFTDDPPERVIDYYAGRLRALGFAVDPPSVEDDRVRLRGRAPRGGRDLAVETGSNSQNTWIHLQYKWTR